jgi:TPR repeat protein
MYYNGTGVAQDYKQAHTWYLKAAEQGDADAQNALGVMYQEGHGVARNMKDAIAWYKKAAERGHAKAQTNLGNLYAAGKDISQDYAQAFELYKKAADQNYAQAQVNLGICYAQGIGVTQDHIEAYKWLTLARRVDPQGIDYLLAELEKGMPAPELEEAKNRATSWLVEYDKRRQAIDASKPTPQGAPVKK